MNYVLTERSMQWLREQMARTRGYTPATQTPSRQVRRDTSSATGTPHYHFRYNHSASTSGGQTTHTVAIGEGAVQIGGYTYFSPGGSVANMGSGTQYVCVVVTLASGAISFAAYASTSALNTAQSDLSKYIFPLYKVVDYSVMLDFRPMPNAGCWEIAESVANGGSS